MAFNIKIIVIPLFLLNLFSISNLVIWLFWSCICVNTKVFFGLTYVHKMIRYSHFLWKMAEDWEAAPAVAESPEIKLFGKWSTEDVQINDISLQVCVHGHSFLWEMIFICH